MVLHMVLQREQRPGELIQSGCYDMAWQHHNADKAAAGLPHLLLHRGRYWHWGLQGAAMVTRTVIATVTATVIATVMAIVTGTV